MNLITKEGQKHMTEKHQDDSCLHTCVPLARLDERVKDVEKDTKLQWDEFAKHREIIDGMRTRSTATLTATILCLLGIMGTLIVVIVKA